MTLDKALSLIVADDKLLGIADNTISEIVTAFETFFNRKFRIYKPEFTTQLNFLQINMKTTIISCVILFVFLLYVGHFSITIKPFTAQLPYWHRSLGLFLLILLL